MHNFLKLHLKFLTITLILPFLFSTGGDQKRFLPKFKGKQFGLGLSNGLGPVHKNAKELIGNFHEIRGISLTTTPPQTRRERGKAFLRDDQAQMRGLDILINEGIIKKGIMILSDTGHDLSTAGYFMKEYYQKFNIQSSFFLPAQLFKDSGNYERLIAQAQDWGEDIAYFQKLHAEEGKPEILFIGLEGHRKDYTGRYIYEIPIRLLPTKEQLQKLGIDQVVFMTEAHPYATQETIKKKMRRDVIEYLNQISLPVIYAGNDCRREGGC